MHVWMHICVYVYVWKSLCACTCVYVLSIYACVCMNEHVCLYLCVCDKWLALCVLKYKMFGTLFFLWGWDLCVLRTPTSLSSLPWQLQVEGHIPCKGRVSLSVTLNFSPSWHALVQAPVCRWGSACGRTRLSLLLVPHTSSTFVLSFKEPWLIHFSGKLILHCKAKAKTSDVLKGWQKWAGRHH